MLSDPRIGLFAALGVAMLAAAWLLGVAVAGDAIRDALGMNMHPITFLAIFLGLAALPVALLFGQYASVRGDLLAGRDVVARWKVDPDLFARYGVAEMQRDSTEKRGALIFILVLMALIFGGFALADPEVAGGMGLIGAGVALAIVAAYLLGQRVKRRHMQLRSGDIVVGGRGLLVNDVLHVWGSFMSYLSAVSFSETPPALTVTYTIWTRLGPQPIAVPLPFSAAQVDQARAVAAVLKPRSSRRRRG